MGLMNWLNTVARPVIQTFSHFKATKRFGQSFDTADIDGAIRRVALLNIVVFGLPDLAIGDGFDVRDKNGEIVSFQKKLNDSNFFDESLLARNHVSAYGAADMVLFKDNECLTFKPAHVSFDVDKEGKMEYVSCKEMIGGRNVPVYHKFGERSNLTAKKYGSKFSKDDTLNSLDDHFHIVIHRSDKKYEGITEIEKGWDIALAFNDILESCMVYCGRVAYGLKVAYAVSYEDKAQDDLKRANLKESLANLDARDTNVVLYGRWKGDTYHKDELKIDSGQGNFDYAKNGRMFLEAFAGLYGVPVNWLIGLFQGQTIGAPAVIQLLYGKLKEIQDKWTPHITKPLVRWTEINGETWEDGNTIDWRLKPGLDKNKADTIKVLVDAQMISSTEGRNELGFKGEAPQPMKISLFDDKKDIDKNETDIEGDIDA